MAEHEPRPAGLLRAGDGETITDRTARTVRILADHPLLGMTWSRYGPGERGPSAHVHHDHADAWWILEGALTFTYGRVGVDERTVTVGAGGFVLMPPDVAHSFQNLGDEDVTFLNPHAPDCDFATYMRALRDGRRRDAARFDQHDPPADGGRPADEAVVLQADEGQLLDLGPQNRMRIKAGGGDGTGSLTLTEVTVGAGFPGPLAHTHAALLDGFYVLEGTLDLRVGDVWVTAGPGDYAIVPAGNVHTFANRSDAPARFLNLIAPGGFEGYLVEVAGELRPGVAPDPARMAEIASRYDFATAP